MKERCPTCGRPTMNKPAPERLRSWLFRRLNQVPTGLTVREVTIACASRDRHTLHTVLAAALDDGSITFGDDGRTLVIA